MRCKFVAAIVAFLCVVLGFVLWVRECRSETLRLEKEYQVSACNAWGGTTEVVTDHGTRCDCLTPEYAIEVDFAHKYAEAIGQSINYSLHLGKKPGILLILESPSDKRYLDELVWEDDKGHLGIAVWTIDPAFAVEKVR